eukprot:gene1285-1360_t
MAGIVERLFCKDPTSFNEVIDKATQDVDRKLFVLFTATKNPSTGLTWCPDCNVASPIIDEVLSKLTTPTTIVICDVDREPYRTSGYLYRVDPRINLRCVPTLLKWENGKGTLRLNDHESQIPAAVNELFDS